MTSQTANKTAASDYQGLVERAQKLVPLLRKTALATEKAGRLPQETIEALDEAGIFRMAVPQHYGGYEADWRTIFEVLAAIASGCPSTAWLVRVMMPPTWMIGRARDELQDEVFASPDVRIPSTFGSTGARAKRVPGGIQVLSSGRWRFNSGCYCGHWDALTVLIHEPDGSETRTVMVVPMSDLRILDDWHPIGGAGTESNTVVCDDIFVPEHRLLDRDRNVSRRNADRPFFSNREIITAGGAGLPLGMARGALEAFLEQIPSRHITHTDYTNQAHAPITHLQVGEVALKINCIEALSLEAGDVLARYEGQALPPDAALKLTANRSYCMRLAREAIDILFVASGSSGIMESDPVSLFQRDIQAFNQHAGSHPDTNIELYGRILCGLPPFGKTAHSTPDATGFA